MPATWIIGPVVNEGEGFWPLVSRIVDPGREGEFDPEIGDIVPKTLGHSSAIVPGQPWCLSLIVGEDLTGAIDHPEIDFFLPQMWTQAETRERVKTYLNPSLVERGWTGRNRQAFRDAMEARGASQSDLRNNQPLWRFVRRVGRRVHAKFDPRRHHTFVRGVA